MDVLKKVSKKDALAGMSVLFLLYTICKSFEQILPSIIEELTNKIVKIRKLLKWQREMSEICPGPVCHPLLGNIREMIDAKGFSQELFVNLHSQ